MNKQSRVFVYAIALFAVATAAAILILHFPAINAAFADGSGYRPY